MAHVYLSCYAIRSLKLNQAKIPSPYERVDEARNKSDKMELTVHRVLSPLRIIGEPYDARRRSKDPMSINPECYVTCTSRPRDHETFLDVRPSTLCNIHKRYFHMSMVRGVLFV